MTSRALPIRDAFADLDEIYAELPKLECKRLCHESCGPILMGSREWRRLSTTYGRGRLTAICGPGGTVGPLPDRETLACPLLDTATNLCVVYAARPLICRLWGLVKAMACPFGCVPERWLSDAEAYALMDRVESRAPHRWKDEGDGR